MNDRERAESYRNTANQLAERVARLEGAIEAHNNGCLAACGKTSAWEHVRESRRCDPRRDCPDCPRDWILDKPE